MKKFIIKNAGAFILKSELIQPFCTSLGEHKILENALFFVELEGGERGWGEAAVATHITGETVPRTLANLKAAAEGLIGRDIFDYSGLCAEYASRFSNNKCALAALETAVLDSLTKTWGMPFYKFFGAGRSKLTSDITIVISDIEEAISNAGKFFERGFRAFKVKIGKDFDSDFKRVCAVKKAVFSSAVYLDANQGYSCAEALEFLKCLKNHGIKPQLFEQPLVKGDLEGMSRLASLSDVPICADESVSSLKEAQDAVKRKSCDVINIKIMKTGIIAARQIALLAQSNGIDLMIGGMMESSLGMTASAHLAAGLGCFKYIDLDTPFFIRNGLKHNPYLNSRGVYDLSKVKKGIGIRFVRNKN